MVRLGKWLAAGAFAAASVWAGVALTAQEPRPANSDTKPLDLSALREAVDAAARRGENVDDVRKALAAFEKAVPAIKPGRVPPELQALRDAVDDAARKGENVAAVAKELAAVETAVAGRPLAKPKPAEPRPSQTDERPNPVRPNLPEFNPRVMPLPAPNFGGLGAGGLGALGPVGGIDAQAFQKAMDLHVRALELLLNNPNDPEADKLLAESRELMLKALGGNGVGGLGALGGLGGLGAMPGGGLFPDLGGRVPERVRFGVRMEKLAAVTAEQLGIDANTGIAVTSVVPGSPAEKAGVKANDIILEFAGQPVSDDLDAFVRQVAAVKANEKFTLVVMRKGKKVNVADVVLPGADARPAPALPRPNREVPVVPPELPAPPKPMKQLPPPPKPIIDAPVADVPRDLPAVLFDEEPKAAQPDLDALRDAVTAADKRGANVGAIRAALTAFEKAHAKGTSAKPGEAPPELTALRTAVEDARSKGENVDKIADALGQVEKAVTGRAFERPKPAAPPLDPMSVPRLPVRPNGFAGGNVILSGVSSTNVTVSNGNFTIKSRQNDVSYHITGTTDGTTAPKIAIKDGDKTVETDDLKKVPEAYLPTVERLLKSVKPR